jgi:hypothetical protein
MKQKLIEGITGTDTFETWFDKTNEMIDFTNSKANIIKVEIDYSGTVHGVPITTRCSNINLPGQTLTVGEPLFSIASATNDISAILDTIHWDLGHAHMFGRVNGGPTFLAAFTSQSDAWGAVGGSANASVQKNLYGLVSKIISNDTVTKKILLEVVRPGGSFDIKFTDLKTPIWKNHGQTFYLDNIRFGGNYFLGLLESGGTGSFFQNTVYTDSFGYTPPSDIAVDTSQVDGLHYLVITPYNDADETLNVYLHPRAPEHKMVFVSGITAGLTYGSAAITKIIEPVSSEGKPYTKTIDFSYYASDALNGTQSSRWTHITPNNFTHSGKLRILTLKTDTNTDAIAANTLIFIQNYGTADSFTMIHEGSNWNQVGYLTGPGSWASGGSYLNIVFDTDGSFWVINRLIQSNNPRLGINEIG